MKHKKLIIVLLIIFILLLLVLGGGVFAYFTTDFLKTDEQLFYKYFGKAVGNLKTLESQEIADYYTKLETTPYENEGKLSVNVKMPEEFSALTDIDKVNDVNITFSGKVDRANNLNEQDMKLNYSNDVYLPIEYRQINKVFGLASESLLTKYVAIDVDKLDKLLENLDVDDETIKQIMISLNEYEETSSTLDSETFKASINKYKQAIIQTLDASCFSKVNENEFALTITTTKLFDILSNIAETLKTEEFVTEEMQTEIDDFISEIKEYQSTYPQDNTSLNIIVNKNGVITLQDSTSADNTVTIQITENNLKISYNESDTSTTLTLQKQQTETNIAYSFNADVISADDDSSTNINFVSNFSNISTSSPQETYTLGFSVDADDESLSYSYTLNTEKNFVNSVEVESLDSDNALFLNNLDAQTLESFFTLIGTQIVSITDAQMQQLGVAPEQNPLLYTTPLGYVFAVMSSFSNSTNTNIDNTYNQNNSTLFDSTETSSNTNDDILDVSLN